MFLRSAFYLREFLNFCNLLFFLFPLSLPHGVHNIIFFYVSVCWLSYFYISRECLSFFIFVWSLVPQYCKSYLVRVFSNKSGFWDKWRIFSIGDHDFFVSLLETYWLKILIFIHLRGAQYALTTHQNCIS